MKLARWIVLFAAVAIMAPVTGAQAQSTEAVVEPALAPPDPAPQTWGAGQTALMIGMSDFHPRNGAATWTYAGVGYVSRSAGSDLLWATLNLPNGAVIDTIEAFMNDNSAADGRLFLTRFFGTNSFEDIATTNTTGTPGFVTIAITVNRVVDNTSLYVVYLDLPVDAQLTCKGVRVRYRLQVSPAPASATFADVPDTHPFFRFVEALAAAGVTGGCGGGNYCPSSPVTRGEMAVFLSVALGLHFGF